MSRRKTKAGEIRNPEHYFNRYIACERIKELVEDAEYYDLNKSLDSMMERAAVGFDRDTYYFFSINLENEEIEDALAKESILGWIDLIENPQLHKAISSLSTEKKLLLTLRYQFRKTQREIAQILNIKQSSVCEQERRILKDIKKYLD